LVFVIVQINKVCIARRPQCFRRAFNQFYSYEISSGGNAFEYILQVATANNIKKYSFKNQVIKLPINDSIERLKYIIKIVSKYAPRDNKR
jgi:hypothetical protein